MLLNINKENPNPRLIKLAIDCLQQGGVIVYPTDTVYAIGCDIYNKKAMERLCKIKNLNIKKHNLSFICYDLSHISNFTKHLDTNTYKLMKKTLPGPYTFILNANTSIPKIFKNKKKEIGIRIPKNNIARKLVKELGNPIATTSVKDPDMLIEYSTDPDLIHEHLGKKVDIVISDGYGESIPSTIVNCTNNISVVTRKGKGDTSLFL